MVQSRHKGVTKRYEAVQGWDKPAQRRRAAATVNSSAPPAHRLCTTRHTDPAKRYLGVAVVGVAVGASVAPGRVGAGVVGLSVELSTVGVAVEGVAVLGTAVLQPAARIQPSPGLRPAL